MKPRASDFKVQHPSLTTVTAGSDHAYSLIALAIASDIGLSEGLDGAFWGRKRASKRAARH